MRSTLFGLALFAGTSLAHPHKPNSTYVQETRTLNKIYKAAVAEGGVVTVWNSPDPRCRSQHHQRRNFHSRSLLPVHPGSNRHHSQRRHFRLVAPNRRDPQRRPAP